MDKGKSLLVILAVAFLGFVAYNKFSIPMDANAITPDSFYRGSSDKMVINPKDYYNSIHGLTFSGEDACDVTRVKSKTNIPIGNVGSIMYTSVEYDANTNFVELIGVDGSGTFKSGQEIIMPVDFYKFKNSNSADSTLVRNLPNNQHNIEIIGNDDMGRYIIVFEDVMTWWCHAHAPAQDAEHTERVGAGSTSLATDMSKGFVIGIANDTTKVKIYRVKEEFYSAEGESKITAGSVEYDMTVLEQIHAGEYLCNHNEVLVKNK